MFFLLAIILAKSSVFIPECFVIKGCFKSCSQVALSYGSFLRLKSINSQNSLLHFSVYNFGGSLEVIMYIAFSGGILKFGGSPSANSMAIIPVLQTSTFSLYSFFKINSGAIQAGVPTTDFLCYFSDVSYIAKPKSAILTSPSLFNKILSDFKSLCILLSL